MKKILVILALIGLLMPGPSVAQWVIEDNYIGGGTTSGFIQKGGDVISLSYEVDLFDITGMTVDIDNDQNITVAIKTDYAPLVAIGDDTDYGDLFISIDGWNPTGAQPYRDDTFLNSGTTWDYAFDTSSVDPITGVGDIFSTDGNGAYLSNDAGDAGGTDAGGAWSHNWYRRDQLVQYRPGAETTDITGIFSLEQDLLTYSFNLGALDLTAEQGYNLGFRWTQTCANDVIEGGVSVPEPGTVMLLGLGLLGMGAVGRKKFIKT